MADLAHMVGADLIVGTDGDLQVADGVDETNQRVLHRLLTSPGSYIWQLGYGAGLAAMVGSTVSKQQISAIIKSQMALEETVSKACEPVVTVNVTGLSTVNASITYCRTGSLDESNVNVSLGG